MTEERLFTFTKEEVKQMFIDRIPKGLGRISTDQVTIIQSGDKTMVKVDLSQRGW